MRSLFSLLFLVHVGGIVDGQQPLRYKLPTKPMTYSVKVTSDAPWSKSTYQGRVVFTGESSVGDNLTIHYKGGLKESEASKLPSGPGGPFGPGRMPGPNFPFNRPQGRGALRQTASKLTVTDKGEALSVEGETQFPLPLGHLSLLMFEPLPDEGKNEWTHDTGVLVGQRAEDNSRFPGDPFARPATPGQTSSGTESSTFKVTGTQSSRVSLDKTYLFNSPHSSPAFEVKGGGSLTFDTELGWMTACNVKYDFTITAESITIKIPLTIEYEYLTDEQVAALDLQAKETANKAKEAAEQATMERREAMVKSFSHLTQEQMNDLYRKGALIPPTNREISPSLRLPAGLIIISKWKFDDKWQPAKVLRELPDGQIEFESVETKKVYQRHRNTLMLAPDYIDQPNLSAAQLAAFRRQLGGEPPAEGNSFRTWSDTSKTFTVEAKLVANEEGNVVLLRKSDNRELRIPISKLSQEDQAFLRSLPKKAADPFK